MGIIFCFTVHVAELSNEPRKLSNQSSQNYLLGMFKDLVDHCQLMFLFQISGSEYGTQNKKVMEGELVFTEVTC